MYFFTRNKKTHQRGFAILTLALFFTVVSIAIVFGVATPALKQSIISREATQSRQSYYLAESATEDAVYRIKTGKQIGSTSSITLNGDTATADITETLNGQKVTSESVENGLVRKIETDLVVDSGATFNYGVQAGDGGFYLEGGSKINGNVYSNGDIEGDGGVEITGSAVATGEISGDNYDYLTIGDLAWAPIINSSKVSGNFYCQSTNNNPHNTCDPSKGTPPTTELSIKDDAIDSWKSEAEAGGVHNGNITVGWQNGTYGPTKIVGDLSIGGGGTMTVTGTLWITGDLTLGGGGKIKLSPLYGHDSGVIIVDGHVQLNGGGSSSGSGQSGSYPVIIATSDCPGGSSCGRHSDALKISGGAGAVVLVAPHGTLTMSGGTSVRALMAKKIHVTSGATVNYDSGLSDITFSAGPAGGFNIVKWQEIQ